jgi:hypothetical protein
MSTAAIGETVRVARPRARAVSIARIALLVLVFSASAVYESVRLSAFSNTEVWLHLRTGLWILQNHAFPRSGLFSQYPNLPWMATSWGFDVQLAAGYKLLGLRAIPLLLMILKMALALVIYLLARAARAGRFLVCAGALRDWAVRDRRSAAHPRFHFHCLFRNRAFVIDRSPAVREWETALLAAATDFVLGECGPPVRDGTGAAGAVLRGRRAGKSFAECERTMA